MCMQHAPVAGISYTIIEEKENKHVEMVSKSRYEKGDAHFVDERTSKYIPKKKSSFLETLFGS